MDLLVTVLKLLIVLAAVILTVAVLGSLLDLFLPIWLTIPLVLGSAIWLTPRVNRMVTQSKPQYV